MFLRDTVKGFKHNWQYDVRIFINQAHYVFVIPEIQSSFSDLMVLKSFYGFQADLRVKNFTDKPVHGMNFSTNQ